MKIKTYALLLTYLLLGSWLYAQDSLKTISGKVIDFKTKEPISFVVINNMKTNSTVQTDEKGNFRIYYYNKASVFLISKLGYSTQALNINDVSNIPFVINLKRQLLDLSEVVITADKPVKRLVDNTFYILDYQFINNEILLFGELNDKPMIKRIDLDGKEISRLALNGINYESLFKDCFGNIHIVSKYHTNQVYFVNKAIHILDDIRRELFDSIVKPCILDNIDNLYFETLLNKKQTKTFFVINKTTKQKSGLGIFSDEFKMSMMGNEAGFIEAKYGGTGSNTMENITADELRNMRRKEDDINFAARIIFTDAYIPILINNDTITVFDHPNNLIHSYTLNNIEVDLKVMEYNHYKNWKPLVISDEIKHKFYTTYLHDGIITLGEINLKNGKIERRFKLTHTFPKNIKVKNGIVYYLYKLRDSEDKMAIYANQIE